MVALYRQGRVLARNRGTEKTLGDWYCSTNCDGVNGLLNSGCNMLRHATAGHVLKDSEAINLVRAGRTVVAEERYLEPCELGYRDPGSLPTPNETLIFVNSLYCV